MLVSEVQSRNISLALVTAPKPAHDDGMLVMEVQPRNISLVLVTAPKPVHEAGMIEREVQSRNIAIALVTLDKPAHDSGMLVSEVQFSNILLALVKLAKPIHEAGIPRKLVHPLNKDEVFVYVLDVPQDSTPTINSRTAESSEISCPVENVTSLMDNLCVTVVSKYE